MNESVEFEALKSGARWRPGQRVPCELGAALDDEGLGTLRAVLGAPGSTALRARALPGAVEAWRQRVRKLTVLGHPNVVSIVGLGERRGELLLFEERPDGESARRWAQKVRAAGHDVPLQAVEQIASQVASALRHTHDAGLAHGGLEAGCVNVASHAVGGLDVRVGCCGLTQTLREQRAELPAPLWATFAPEAAAEPSRVDTPADLFAFGVLLVELLTGDGSPKGTRQAWREVAAQRPGELRKLLGAQRADVPDGVWDLLAGLLHADVTRRSPTTVRDLSRALQGTSWEPKAPARVETPAPRVASGADRTAGGDREPAPRVSNAPKIVEVSSRRVAPTADDPSTKTTLDADAPDITMREEAGKAPHDTVQMPRVAQRPGAVTIVDRGAGHDVAGPPKAALRNVLRGAGGGARLPAQAQPQGDRTLVTPPPPRPAASRDEGGAALRGGAGGKTLMDPAEGATTLPLAKAPFENLHHDGAATLPVGGAPDDGAATIDLSAGGVEEDDDSPDITVKQPTRKVAAPLPIEAQTLPMDAPRTLPMGAFSPGAPIGMAPAGVGGGDAGTLEESMDLSLDGEGADAGFAWWKLAIGVVVVGGLLGWVVAKMVG